MAANGDELRQRIREAVAAVEESNVPDDLRVAAFEKAFEMVLGQTAAREQDRQERDAGSDGPGDPLTLAARRLGVDEEVLRETFYWDGEEISLSIAASRLDRSRAGATREIAILIAAARQAAGIEEWTPTRVIREVCQEYGRFDSANFAGTVRSLGDVFSFRGRAQDLHVRLTRPGFERAAELIAEVHGG